MMRIGLRVGLISADFAPNIGGVASHVLELGKALGAAGHEVHVITLPLGETQQAPSWPGVTVHRAPIPHARPFFSWVLKRWLKNFLNKQPLDVLHVHGLRPLEASRGLDIPVIFTNHTSGFLKRIQKGSKERRKMSSRLSHVSYVLAPSEELAEATRSVGYTGPVEFIPNGVDTDRFCPGPTPLRNQWAVADDDVVILLARRLVEKNGVIVFARASEQLQGLAVRLVFAGEGPEQTEIETILTANKMKNRAIFLGSVPNDQMPEVYRAADISVLPSFMEATSITGLESMASALPLVGSRVGGIPALIEENVTGLLVPVGDPTQLGSAIRGLVDNPEQRHSMGQKARDRAIEHFSWSRIADDTAAIYQHIIKKAA